MSDQDLELIQEARVWQAKAWTARVIKNDDDDGWAVAMYKDGQAEPALIGRGRWDAIKKILSL